MRLLSMIEHSINYTKTTSSFASRLNRLVHGCPKKQNYAWS